MIRREGLQINYQSSIDINPGTFGGKMTRSSPGNTCLKMP